MIAKIPPSLLSFYCALIFALSCAGCDKRASASSPGSAEGQTASPSTNHIPSTPQLADFADKLGFMSQLPADTDFYLGAVHVKAHVAAFKQSHFFKALGSSLEKASKPDASENKSEKSSGEELVGVEGPLLERQLSRMESFLGDDCFVAGGRGTSTFMASMMEFVRFSQELNMRRLGETKGAPVDDSAPFSFLEALLQVPELRQRVENWLLDFDIPPLLAGLQMDEPEAGAKVIFSPEFLAEAAGGVFERSSLKTTEGIEFQVLSTDGSKFLTQERKRTLLENLPESVGQEVRVSLERALDQARSKRLCLGWGIRGKYLLFAVGKNLDHVRFAGLPKESLVSLPEMAALRAFADKNLMLLSYGSQPLLKQTVNSHPLLPLLRSFVDGLKVNADEDAQIRAVAKVEELLPEYGKLEEAVFNRNPSSQVGVVWWEQGLKAEFFGGMEGIGYAKAKPLRFAPLIEDSKTLLGIAYQHDRGFEAKQTAWVESLLQMVYAGASEFVKNGGAGIVMQAQFSLVETAVLPHLLQIYGAQREMSLKGLGTDTGFLLDAEGKMPSIPGAPAGSKGKPLLRFTTFSEVANRAEVASSWEKTITAITTATKQGAGGAVPGGSPGSSAFALPDPISSEKNGVTSYFFGLPFFSGDLLPCASLNDTLLMLSTSKTAAETYAGVLAKGTSSTSDGFVLAANPSALIRHVSQTAELFGNEPKPSQKEAFQQALKWTKPFQTLRTRFFEENGLSRRSFSWLINDLDPTE